MSKRLSEETEKILKEHENFVLFTPSPQLLKTIYNTGHSTSEMISRVFTECPFII